MRDQEGQLTMAADPSNHDSAEREAEQPDAQPDATESGSGAEGSATKDDTTESTGSTRAEVMPDSTTDTTANSAGDPGEAPESASTPTYSPALIATAVALPVVLIVGVLVAAVLARNAPTEREPLVLGAFPAPAADSPACTNLLPALPADLGEFTVSTVVEPAPPATRAWQRPEGGEAIVLRCGVDRPLEFNRASPLQIVNGVQWFEIRDQALGASTWFAVDRGTYIALTVPDGSGPTPLQEISDTITDTLAAQPITPGPLPN
ncbi:DUF3515 family protein [Nocardia sp. 004]|uniref:DUF3515 domain-containing protein n=1 Tax=Nocardia sp. 004 TaxID=3385978 RepID=UPI0039A34A90